MKFRNMACLAICAATTIACKKEAPSADEGDKGTVGKTSAAILGNKIKSVAREHLPAGCEIIASLDLPRFREMKSVKGTIDDALEKFEAPPVPNAPVDPETAADIKKAKEFLAKTQIDLHKDPGELAFCAWKLAEERGDAPPPFVVVLGGHFIPGAAMEALDSFSERIKGLLSRARPGGNKKAPPEMIEIGGVKVAFQKEDGMYFAQAKDGAFVIGNDRPSFERALGTGKDHEAYKLPGEPVALTLTRAAGPLIAPQLAQSPFAPAAGAFGGANLGFEDGLIKLQIELTDPKLIPALQSNLDMFIKPNPMMPPNPFTAALAQAKVTTSGSSLTLEVPLPDDMTQSVLQQAGVGAAPPRPLVPPGHPGLPQGAMPPGVTPQPQAH